MPVRETSSAATSASLATAMHNGSLATNAKQACPIETDAACRRVCTAKRLRAERVARERMFGKLSCIFRDPAWDIALDLFVAAEEGRAVSASSASIASRTPMSTGLRCIDRMVENGVLQRRVDPIDARRSLVSLTDDAAVLMTAYLDFLKSSDEH